MLKTASSSRIHLVAQARGAGGKQPDPAIRRFRLARLRLDSRPIEFTPPGRAQRI
jgi:hypothetical protein